MSAMNTKQYNLRLEESLISKLEAIAARSGVKSGNQTAVEFVLNCVRYDEELNDRLKELGKKYDVQPGEGSIFELIQNYLDLYLQAKESEIATRQEQRQSLGKAKAVTIAAPARRKAS